MRLLFHKKKNQTENAPEHLGKWDGRQDGKTFTQGGVQGAASRVDGPSRERPAIDKPPEIRYSIADSQGEISPIGPDEKTFAHETGFGRWKGGMG